MNFIVDTHAHLADDKLIADVPRIIERCKSSSVLKIISIGCSLCEAKKSIELSNEYRGMVFATAGIYPHDNSEGSESEMSINERLAQLKNLATHENVVAIGEFGFDYTNPLHEKVRSKEDQKFLFYEQAQLATDLNKPAIIHSRDAVEDTLSAIKNFYKYGSFRSVWHCFTENYDIAKKALDLNMMLSFTGIITYPSATLLRDVVLNTPLDRIMFETDCPYLVPQMARKVGVKVNDPSYVRMVAQEIADIKGLEVENIIEITTKNAINFFGC